MERRKKARDGLTLFKRGLGRARAIFTGEKEKVILEGPLSIRIQESEKYGRELLLNVYGPKDAVRVEGRIPSPWSRQEIYISLSENIRGVRKIFEETAEELKKLEEKGGAS